MPKKGARITNKISEGLEKFEISQMAYLHKAFINAIDAVPKAIEGGKSPEDGFTVLICAVDQGENIAYAAKLLKEKDEDGYLPVYNEAVASKSKALIQELPGDGDRTILLRQARLSNFKLRLLLRLAFERSPKDFELTI